MIAHRRCPILFVAAVMLATAATSAQIAVPFTDTITGLSGEWKRDPARGAGGICGVSPGDAMTFAVTADPPSVTVASRWVNATLPVDGSTIEAGSGRTVTATTDAGWLKVTMSTGRGGGFANVMQEAYILNRDGSELTLWRTLNTVRPDGTSGKIDCGNRAAEVFVRQVTTN